MEYQRPSITLYFEGVPDTERMVGPVNMGHVPQQDDRLHFDVLDESPYQGTWRVRRRDIHFGGGIPLEGDGDVPVDGITLHLERLSDRA